MFFSPSAACIIDTVDDTVLILSMTEFTSQQEKALNAVGDWLGAKPGANGTPQVFRLFGYAGTGKTTLARHIADAADGEVKFAAVTGKPLRSCAARAAVAPQPFTA